VQVRIRGPVLALLSLSVLSGCLAGDDRSARTTDAGRRVVLEAAVSEPPRRWARVLAVGFGGGERRLGSVQAERFGAPVFPLSFAVARDGSFWILDPVKRRVAHFSRRGGYVGELRGGIRFELRHPLPKDVVVVGERVHLLEERTGRGFREAVRELRPGAPARVTSLVRRGRGPLLLELVPNQPRLTAFTLGEQDQRAHLTGRSGVGWLEVPGSGAWHPLPGYPLREGWASLVFRGSNVIELTRTRPSGAPTSRRVEIDVVDDDGKRAATIAAAADVLPVGDSLGLYLRVSSDYVGRPNVGGRWYLQLSAKGVETWERLPEGTIRDDSIQERHITTGPDGTVHLMLANRTGIEILERR
jgi:hypothetical protein